MIKKIIIDELRGNSNLKP